MNKKIPVFLLILLIPLMAFGQKSWYELKSGVIQSIVNAGGVVLQQTEYFEEWGNSVSIESVMGVDEYSLKTRTIYGDKFMTMIKLEQSSGVRYPRVRPRINWLELDDVTRQVYNIRYLGKVDLKGYKCDLYKYTIQDNGRSEEVTNWVYKGVPIQYTTVNNGITMEQEFLTLDENPEIDPEIFEIPYDIQITEM